MEKVELLQFLQSHKSEFLQKYDVTEIALFGSYAKGLNHADSDIDIVIDMNNKNYFKLLEFETFLTQKLHKKVDVGFLSSMKSYIKTAIKKDLIYV